MKHIRVAALAGLLGLAACSDCNDAPLTGPELSFGSAGVVRVTNPNATGLGSFHQAIQVANANPAIHRVEFARRLGTIALTEPIVYTGPQALAIDGNRATLDGQALPTGAAGFTANGGGNLDVHGLTVRRAPGPGLVVAVPAAATGTIKVTLRPRPVPVLGPCSSPT